MSSLLQSKTIDFLRFPLIIGVVFIHNYELAGDMLGKEALYRMPFYYVSSELFSQILGRLAVPCFYFIAGFLFFLNVDFSRSVYLKKLSNRVGTLLVPYLFWNIITLLFFYMCNAIPGISALMNVRLEFSVSYILMSLWDFKFGMPFAYQFWFIRDLMVVVVLTPIIYVALRNLGLLALVGLGVLWFLGGHLNFAGCNTGAVFFFSAGAWFGINKMNLLVEMGKVKLAAFFIYPVLALADLLTREFAYNALIHKFGIIVGIVFLFNLVSSLIDKNRVQLSPFLSASAFFVFSIHALILIVLRKLSVLALRPETDAVMVFLYFANVFIVVISALFIYHYLTKYMPRFAAFITGR